MDDQEKDYIYRQMKIILENINQLMECYHHWREKLEVSNQTNGLKQLNIQKDKLSIRNHKDAYRKGRVKQGYDYQTIALDIASVLKGSDIPLSTKQVHQELLIKGYMISYSNLSNNILQRIQSDSKINVERACRGYWQYRIKF